MSLTILLDSGPLGMVTNPKKSPQSDAANAWLQAHIDAGTRVIVPEIANYELRRELLRADKHEGLLRLDTLVATLEYLPIHTATIYEAARCWADARKNHRPTAQDKSLDADMILVAQARLLNDSDLVIATVDVGDLPHYAPAQLWSDITPSANPMP